MMPQAPEQKKRKPGPAPTTGKGKPLMLRAHDPFLEKVDNWRARQRPIPSRAKAIIELAEMSLDRGGK